MKSLIFSKIILILVCSGSGCAFKEPVHETPPPAAPTPAPTQDAPKAPSPAPVPPPKIKKQGFVSISGSKEKGTPFGEYKREYTADENASRINITSPMTLPERVPKEFTMKIASTAWKAKSLGKVIVRSRLTLDTGVGTELTVSDINSISDAENQTVAWTMNVGGLDKSMPSTEEATQFLQVELYEKGKGDATEIITFPVMTPPSKLSVNQVTIASYESSGGGSNLRDFKTILSTNFRLDLIQVVQLKNDSTLPVIIREPTKVNGNLNSHYKRISVNQRMCSYDAPTDEWVDELATDFFLLPMTKEVAEDSVTFINRKLKSMYWELRLEPGEQKNIGIYAQGAGVVKLTSGNYPMQKLQTTQVVSSCKSRCFNPNQAFFARYWGARGWPGASRHCVESENCPIAEGSWTPRIKDWQCTACMEWDLQTNPWEDSNNIPNTEVARVFCVWHAPMRGWKVEKRYETIQAGIENDDVMLRLAPESALVYARFDLKDTTDVAQERTISGLIRQVTTQQH